MKNSKSLKRIILAASLLFTVYTEAQIGRFQVGPRFGMGASDISVSDVDGERLGFHTTAGISSRFNFTNFFALSADFLLDYRSMYRDRTGVIVDWNEFGPADYVTRTNLLYASVPLLAHLSVGGDKFRVGIMAGPSLNFFLYGDQHNVYREENLRDYDERTRLEDLNTFNPGFLYGIGFYSTTKSNQTVYLDIRHSFGLERIGKVNGNNMYNQNLSLSLGLLF